MAGAGFPVNPILNAARITAILAAYGVGLALPDDKFSLHDPAAPTKVIRFDAGNVTAGQTRVITWQDADQTPAAINLAQTWTAAQTFAPSLAPAINADANAVMVAPTITEAASGTHAILTGMYLATPVIVAGGATVTDAVTLFIQGQPAAAGATNLALYIGSGMSRLRDRVIVGSLTTTNDALRVRGPSDTNWALHVDTAPGQAATYGSWFEANAGVADAYPILQVTDNGAVNIYLRVVTGGRTLIGTATDDGTTQCQVNGAAKITGITSITNATASTSRTTGALVVSGGLGVAGAGYFGDTISSTNGTIQTVLSYGASTGTVGTNSAHDLNIIAGGSGRITVHASTGAVTVNGTADGILAVNGKISAKAAVPGSFADLAAVQTYLASIFT